MKYFAYGSNMLMRRLQARERAPSANKIANAWIQGYKLCFHKRSRDGSSKCDMFKTARDGDVVHGIVFEIDDSEVHALDRAEGAGSGYKRASVTVSSGVGPLLAHAYVADSSHIVEGLRPYSWYRELVIRGAEENRLPLQYIEAIRLTEVDEDPDNSRRDREVAILL